MCNVNEKELAILKSAEVFDAQWYAQKYKDVVSSGLDPYAHFLKYGHKMLRDPSPNFSSFFYYETNPIVKKKGLNPVLHFATRKGGFKPDRNLIIWAMYLLSLKDRDAQAIRLGKDYLENENSLYPFKANKAIKDGDVSKWFEFLNAYLESFGVLPISEKKSDKNILERIEVKNSVKIDADTMVSVIMPAWNVESSIEMAAKSILQQTWQNIELIIIDDASEDSTWELINKIAESDKRVKLLRNKYNVGPYVSKNRGARIAKGDYITGHDSDDWAHPQRIELQVQYLLESNEFACLSGMLRIAENGLLVNFNKVGANTKDGITRSAFISLMVNSHFFRNVLGYWDNVRFGADSELIKRIETVQGKSIAHIYKPTMLCLDNPGGLTNHPVYGHSQNSGVSEVRLNYKKSFLAWHKKLNKMSSYLSFYESNRVFAAPQEAVNEASKMEELCAEELNGSRHISINCDVCIITNLCFPGGNGSSTLEEVRYLSEKGYHVEVVHAPRDTNLNKRLSNRYFPYINKIKLWNDVSKITANHVIVRHPGTVISNSFESIKNLIDTENAYFVINNSMYRTDGELVYDISKLIYIVEKFKARKKEICPISTVIRKEIEPTLKLKDSRVSLSKADWNPTFNLQDYDLAPKRKMSPPFSIGRHGRDGSEKWVEDLDKLKQVYPSDESNFLIKILGGASNAEKILGKIPSNWDVKPFGAISPIEYLNELDVFIYFPNTKLSEAFGRTIVEAMFAGVPCVLPPKFQDVFGELAIYCEPCDVSNIVFRLSENDSARIQYLTEVKEIALRLYSSSAITKRLNIDVISEVCVKSNNDISKPLLSFKRWVEHGQ
ncbi:glycosyltransferase [Vreelandella alkaliphila]